ncbi:MAG: hypothetical protein D4R41_05425 [Sediminibacterium sp.]|nr:MAG: hypothetical protein D4R41_05425 [Sediminibacterium sp.]
MVLDALDICATKAKAGRQMEQKITFSNFNNSSDTTPKEVTEKISKFIARFKCPKEKTLTLKEFHKLSKANQNIQKNGACYCFATFGDDSGKNKYRNKSNVSSISGIAIDVDNKATHDQLTVKDIKKIFKDYFFIVHTTHSSTKEQPRFRVIFQFVEPIAPEKHANVFDYFYNLVGKKSDASTKDVSRLFYYPSCPKGEVDNYYYFVNDGKLFDTSIVPDSVPVGKKKKTKKATSLRCPVSKEIDLDELNIGETLKDSIINGYKKGEFKSKSEHAFDCITQLLQQDIPPETIFCIIANENYAVNDHYSDNNQVWADIVRIEKKLEEQEENGFAVVVGTEPFYGERDYEDPDKICKDIKNDIDTYLNKKNCTYSLGIKAPAGIGKTEVVIKKIVEIVKKERAYIEVYLPSNKLALEFEKRILEADHTVSVQIIHGRYSKNAPKNHCTKSASAQYLASSNVSALSLLCRNKEGTQLCKDYDSCNYRRQYQSNKLVVIYSHKHLFFERNIEERSRKPTLIVIDESFFEQSINDTEIKVDKIDALNVSNTVKAALATKLPYDDLKKHCTNPKKLILDELKKLKAERDTLIETITPSTSELKSTKISESVGKFSTSITLLETIKADYVRMNGGKSPLFLYCQEKYDRDSKENKIVAWHCIKPHSKFKRLRWKDDEEKEESLIPTVYIDADLDKTIASLFFEELKIKPPYVAKRNARVWQLLSNTHAKSDFYGKGADIKIDFFQKKIDHFCKQFEKEVLLVTYKSLLEDELLEDEEFKLPKNCRAIHFGGLRGLDKFKDCEACIVIGRQQLPHDAIDRIAIGLWCDSEGKLPLQQKTLPTKKVRGYCIKNGKKLGMPVSVYEDDRLQAIMEQKRECETLQAIDRLRLIFNDNKKTILILSNVPLDIKLDQYVFYKSATNKINKIIKASESNVISLNSKTLYHSTLYHDKKLQKECSTYFDSEGSTKKIISRWKGLYLNDEKEALVYGVKMKQTKYSFDNRAGSPSYCLHKCSVTEKDIIVALKRIHNTDTIKLK